MWVFIAVLCLLLREGETFPNIWVQLQCLLLNGSEWTRELYGLPERDCWLLLGGCLLWALIHRFGAWRLTLAAKLIKPRTLLFPWSSTLLIFFLITFMSILSWTINKYLSDGYLHNIHETFTHIGKPFTNTFIGRTFRKLWNALEGWHWLKKS